MKTKHTKESAFAVSSNFGPNETEVVYGLSKREYSAIALLSGLLGNERIVVQEEAMIKKAVFMADALFNELDKTEEENEVATESGLTPRQLLEQRNELLDTARSVLTTLNAMVSDQTIEGMKMVLESAIAKATETENNGEKKKISLNE